MQEVPPNTTLFLCAAWRRLGPRNEIPTFAAMRFQWGVRAAFLVRTSSETSFRVAPIFGEIESMSRPCKVSKGYSERKPGTDLLKLPRVCMIIYATIFWSGSLTVAQSDIGATFTSK